MMIRAPSEYRNVRRGGADLAMGTIWRCDTIGPHDAWGLLDHHAELDVSEISGAHVP
jgi:hypothetical protein